MSAMTQVIEVDDGMYQTITQHEDGRVVVETFSGLDAYDKHMRHSVHEYNDQGRTSNSSGTSSLRYKQSYRRHNRTSWYWQNNNYAASVPLIRRSGT